MNPLASLSSSPSRSAAATAQPSVRNSAADAQATLANRLAERLGLEPGALAGKANDYTPEKVAGRILGFIEQRLQSEQAAGADPSKLQGLLEQARSGVEKGFAEARKILDGMGVLQGKVASDIDDTYQKIQDGFSALDNRFKPSTPAGSGTVAAAAYRERFAAQAETFDMEVTTRDGDRLRISIAQASANWSQSAVAASSNGASSALVASSQSGSLQIGAWQVSVEGELDDEERGALEKLFGQVQELSDKFYAGDLSGAFDRAMALDMDGEQLASMSLRLTQTTVRQATDAYSAVAQDGGQAASAVNASLMDYAQGLLEALRSASQLTEEGGAKGSLLDLLKGGFSLDERFDSGRLDKAEQLNSRLLDGLQNLLPQALDGSKSLSA
ncbi:hypothetical protein DBR00_13535 [Pseudomonas sp. HMWF032]|uniref:DUF5610 domain-containing protein n=1 Tax=unclassified Pseudomonas TaxID=196821 RepID=UPI000D3A3FA8|nr:MULTISPECIES: DUF5610 domain-containing protein [unclassified Pseudomonas]PTS83528.1 hypothetical protein DBR00_13535 [Pseudomonas sp. HMWF032]PTT84112.1 hypothetical protein DBR41_09165 [Pseudomonas sp. HMWF010]WAC44760.1 DUF5610 domain-containing protein [Pseudomonas sp. SL4(2022)]